MHLIIVHDVVFVFPECINDKINHRTMAIYVAGRK